MKRAILIFKKDTARLWPQILIFWATLIAFAIEDPTHAGDNGFISLERLVVVLLPVSCWLLVTGLIHEEKAIGLNHYWVTRPFGCGDLLAANALFLLAFVHVPVFVCQAIVLSVHGFSPVEYFGDLVAKQIFLVALLVLPMAAVASVTKSLGHAFLTVLSVSVVLEIAIVAANALRPSSWGGLEWIRNSAAAIVAACGAAAILWIQYRRRRTGLSRWVVAAVLVAVLAIWTVQPWQPAFVFQAWLSQRRVAANEVRIAFDRARETPVRGTSLPQSLSMVEVDLPIRVENLPAGLDIDCDWIWIQGEAVGMKPWRPGETACWKREGSGMIWLPLLVNTNYFERAKDVPMHLSGTIDVTLSEPGTDVRSFGLCYSSWPLHRFECLTPRPRAQIEETAIGGNSLYVLWPQAYAPYPTSPWFSPLVRVAIPTLNVKVEHPVAHIVRGFDFGQLKLATYQAVPE